MVALYPLHDLSLATTSGMGSSTLLRFISLGAVLIVAAAAVPPGEGSG